MVSDCPLIYRSLLSLRGTFNPGCLPVVTFFLMGTNNRSNISDRRKKPRSNSKGNVTILHLQVLHLRFKLRDKIRYLIILILDARISPNRTPILKWRRDLSSFSENFRSSFRHPLCFMTMQARRNYSVGLPH